MSEIDTTILTDVRIYAQKLRDTLKNVVLQMQAEVNKRDGALSQEDREAAQRFQDKLHASADEADALVKGLEPHVPTFLTQPYPEFAGGNAKSATATNSDAVNTGSGVAVGADGANAAADEELPIEGTSKPRAEDVDVPPSPSNEREPGSGGTKEDENDSGLEVAGRDAGHHGPEAAEEAKEEADEEAEEAVEAEDETNEEEACEDDDDDDMSPEARAILEGFKRLTGGRPDPRMGWGRIPDRYK